VNLVPLQSQICEERRVTGTYYRERERKGREVKKKEDR
jgi:hypothetical protein